MPLVLTTGYPSAGKTAVVNKLVHFLLEEKGWKNENLSLINDTLDGNFSRQTYQDSNSEREHRGFLRSEVQRKLSQEHLVICDSLNYIKSFRYEFFCIAKEAQTTYCVIFCQVLSEGAAGELNSRKPESER